MRRIEVISEGYFLSDPDERGALPRNCRVVLLPDGTLVASVVFHLGIGTGVSYTRAFRSRHGGGKWEHLGLMCDGSGSRKGYSERLNVSRAPDGKLLALGMLWEKPAPGTTYYDRHTGGAADTDLVFSVSSDEGLTWNPPRSIPMCYPEPPEVGGVICSTRAGKWLAPFAPWLDRQGQNAHQGKAAVMISEDEGKSWPLSAEFMDDPSGRWAFQEVWVEELSDGRILGTAFARDMVSGQDQPVQYSLSADGGETFSPNRSTGLAGQTTSTRALEDGRVVCVYNRRHQNPGVGFAVARPDESGFNVEFDALAWSAWSGFRGDDGDTQAMYWADFSFGEPCVVRFADGSFYLAFWCHEKERCGSRYVHLRLV